VLSFRQFLLNENTEANAFKSWIKETKPKGTHKLNKALKHHNASKAMTQINKLIGKFPSTYARRDDEKLNMASSILGNKDWKY